MKDPFYYRSTSILRCNSLCIDEWCGVLNRLGKITYPEKETLGGIPIILEMLRIHFRVGNPDTRNAGYRISGSAIYHQISVTFNNHRFPFSISF